jgi:uncharacterized membrane protein
MWLAEPIVVLVILYQFNLFSESRLLKCINYEERKVRDMNCQNCQSVLPQGAIYCARCGTSQNSNPPSPGQITQIPFPPPAESGWIRQPQVVQSSAKYDVITLEHQEHGENGQHEEQKEPEEEEDNERLMVFSDGIIAFALTVAAITIKIPTSAEELQVNGFSIWLRVIMYIIAFIIVISAWADHHTIFHHIKRNNVTLVVLNFFYLAAIVMFPMGLFFTEFGLELTDTSPTLSQNQILLGLGIFLGSQMLASLTLCRMWLYAKHHSRLLDTGLDPHFSAYMTKRLIAKPVTFLFIVVVLLLNFVLPYIALLMIPVAFIARAIYFRRARRGIDLTVGTNDTQRIQLFSDAVIGIAITLAVAQIEFPTIGGDTKNAQEAVNHQWPLLHAFLVGIVIIGVYWLFHYHLFRFIKRHDTTLIFLNNFFLLAIALMIIPVNWFVNYYNQPDLHAHLFFGFWQILTSLVLVALWRHVSHKKRLLSPDASPEQIKQFNIIVIAHPVVFLVLTIISGIFPGMAPSLYIGIYLVLMGSVWLFSQRLMKRQTVSLKVSEQDFPTTIVKQ